MAAENNISFESCKEDGIQIDYINETERGPIDNIIVMKDMLSKLVICLTFLDEKELMLIDELFFKGLSERQLSAKTGIPQKTIDDRKHRILLKLKKIIEK